MAFPTAKYCDDLASALQSDHLDALIVIAENVERLQNSEVKEVLSRFQKIDARINSVPLIVSDDSKPGGRLLFSATGPLDRYYDDVRRFFDAGQQAAVVVLAAGIKAPAILVEAPDAEAFKYATSAAYLGFCQGLWQPLEAREALNEQDIEPIENIVLIGSQNSISADWLVAAEAGKRLARDLCGTEPERMAPPAFADYCVDSLAGTGVKVEVISDQKQLASEYPLLFSVARASESVARHQARVITMTYEGEGPIEHSLYLAGKGITYDTGGADLKVGGHMAGMSRDKGGAATVAGFMKMIALLKPKGLKVVA